LRYAIYWNKVIGKTVLHEITCGHYKKHLGKWEDTPNGGWYEDLSFEEAEEIQAHSKNKNPGWDHYSCAVCRPDQNFQQVLEFLKREEGKTFRSPRGKISKGRKPMQFKIEELNEIKEKVKIKFESGTILPLEFWRFKDALNILQKKEELQIGARISEDYPDNSLEQILKEEEKRRYSRSAGTKTAPHIADLLTNAGITELKFVRSESGREVQGIKLKIPYKRKKRRIKSKYDRYWQTKMEEIRSLLKEANEKGKSRELDVFDILNWGERKSWYGIVKLSKKMGIEKEKSVFVHIRSLARLILKNQLVESYSDQIFRLKISTDIKLVIERLKEKETSKLNQDVVEFVPPIDNSNAERAETERRSFHCQIDGEKHPATDSAYECENCSRYVCADCLFNMISTGVTGCPYCDGNLLMIQ
jgi:hypothetical protein